MKAAYTDKSGFAQRLIVGTQEQTQIDRLDTFIGQFEIEHRL